MIATSHKTEIWLRHIWGTERLTNRAGIRELNEAVELNKDGADIISSFGKREFSGLVGFIDMRGFTTRASGKTPAAVRDIAAPFVSTVVETAAKHECIIDKSIGDEVMVVMPWFDRDTVLSDVRLVHRQIPLIDLSVFLLDLVRALAATSPEVKFSSGFMYGPMVLDKVGQESFSEWTVYGNCVNAAKRLQSLPKQPDWRDENLLSVGAVLAEHPEYAKELSEWIRLSPALGPLILTSASPQQQILPGVGACVFVQTVIEPKPECL